MSKKDQFFSILKSAKISKKTRASFETINREVFFDRSFKNELYQGTVLPIGYGEKSDDPVTLAKMIDLLGLKKTSTVLEVGTGTGYSTALLASLAAKVTSVEYVRELALAAKNKVHTAGFTGTSFLAGDATEINKTKCFDALIIFAGCSLTPKLILDTLVPGGIAVFPMGPSHQQQIVRYVRDDSKKDPLKNYEFHDYCFFNSIRGPYGWRDQVQGYFIDHEGVQK
ncbi:MAG TPA: methyltransferase domain-containing protein [Spirochaetota bacterium]|nr:methyltransferase domain-containing protein [Spirochaetota bacterium]HPI90422.1 methyltransferase domain-containing protein [Spirochaetota bacterium]HPR46548.1 methyltransferase domain-containing protein [Spirochaetota bacterium]